VLLRQARMPSCGGKNRSDKDSGTQGWNSPTKIIQTIAFVNNFLLEGEIQADIILTETIEHLSIACIQKCEIGVEGTKQVDATTAASMEQVFGGCKYTTDK
jgi:hypothetical protein